MRDMDANMTERVESQVQTIANNANPSLFMRLSRYNIPLKYEKFIERTRIVKASGITDSDVAVCHPYFLRGDEDIWVAYTRNDTLHIKRSKNTEAINKTDWTTYWFTTTAVACAIAFNSTVRHNVRGIWEFVTEREPWVFWVASGALMAKKCTPLGGMEHELAVANVTDVSAVRGPGAESGSWDLGLTVFFVMAGQLYYRQLINNEWCDAERITFPGLNDLTIEKIKAFNTWDYRVGLQILTDTGDLYELYSYTEGIGVRGSEHLDLDLLIEGNLKKIGYDTGYENEHLSLGLSFDSEMIYGLSSVPVSIANINYQGNWGLYIDVDFDYPNTDGDVSEFTLVDSSNNYFRCDDLEIIDGTKLRLRFYDFNNAVGDLTLTYTQGTLHSIVPLTDSFTLTFTPTNLNSQQGFPVVDEIYNM